MGGNVLMVPAWYYSELWSGLSLLSWLDSK